jgi:hypothetical protein
VNEEPQYVVLWDSTPERLAVQVTRALRNGWQTSGGILWDGVYYRQAITWSSNERKKAPGVARVES